MGRDNVFDAIVVGAGPAGTTASLVLARAGMNVVQLERGASPGNKNVFGGILFTTVLNRLIPNFWEQAPVERHVKGVRIYLISADNAVSIGVESEEHNRPPYNNSFTVSRARFDQWYASKAEEAGALLLTNTVVYNVNDIDDLVDKMENYSIKLPTRLNPHIPKALEDIMMRALEVNAANRYQTAKEMLQDLEHYMYDDKYGPTNEKLARYLSRLFPWENKEFVSDILPSGEGGNISGTGDDAGEDP